MKSTATSLRATKVTIPTTAKIAQSAAQGSPAHRRRLDQRFGGREGVLSRIELPHQRATRVARPEVGVHL
jgi:hypothetical protein